MQLREYQVQAIETLKAAPGNPVACMPTGSGKSLVIAHMIRQRMPVLVVTHRKELVTQDYRHFTDLHPELDASIYCAGLGIKEFNPLITFGTIQSLYRAEPSELSKYDTIIVDEAHLIPTSDDSMYRSLVHTVNPTQVMGFTATPFRLNGGLIFGDQEHHLFDSMPVEVKINELVGGGFLAPIYCKRGGVEINTSAIGISGGEYDFGEMCDALDEVFKDALTDLVINMLNRQPKKVLIFTPSIDHAKAAYQYLDVALDLNRAPWEVDWIASKHKSQERNAILEWYKNPEDVRKVLINCEILTTGFDAPDIDMLVLLRSTQSPALYVQMIGRGMRTAPNKNHCILLDYGQNVIRHGSVENLIIPDQGENEKGEPTGNCPMKTCPKCHFMVAVQVRRCGGCGAFFPIHGMTMQAGTAEFLGETRKWLFVEGWERRLHRKGNCVQIVLKTSERRVYVHLWPEREETFRFVRSIGGVLDDRYPTPVADLLAQVKRLPRPNAVLVETETSSNWWEALAVTFQHPESINQPVELLHGNGEMGL